MGKLLENANNIPELESLNNYIDKIEIEPWRNFISTHNLGLFQVFNWISIENLLLKTEFILTLLFLTLFPLIMLLNFLYLIFFTSNAFNLAIGSLLDSPRLVPMLPVLIQAFKSWKSPQKPLIFWPNPFIWVYKSALYFSINFI